MKRLKAVFDSCVICIYPNKDVNLEYLFVCKQYKKSQYTKRNMRYVNRVIYYYSFLTL